MNVLHVLLVASLALNILLMLAMKHSLKACRDWLRKADDLCDAGKDQQIQVEFTLKKARKLVEEAERLWGGYDVWKE